MRRIYAVTRNTIAQGLKMKVALILVAFLIITISTLPVLIKSDGTARGQARLILTYTMNISSFLLYILAAFLSTATLTSDFKGKQMCVVDVSPIRRWEILIGKWLGTVILGAALLVLMGGSIYTLVKTVVKPVNEHEQQILLQEVWTARTRLKPEPPDIDNLVKQDYERFKKGGFIRPGAEEKQVLLEIKRFYQKYPDTVMPRSPRYWKFTGLPVPEGPEAMMAVRYKLNASQKTADNTVQCLWSFGKPTESTSPQIITRDQAGSLHEILVPASGIKPDGTLEVGFVCLENTSVIFDKEKGLEILYKSSSFEANFVKCLIIILIKIAFIAALGIAAGTLLTFPVAALFVFFVLGLCLVSGPLSGVFNLTKPTYGTLSLNESTLFQALWPIIRFIIPDFGKHSGIERLVSGEIINTRSLLKSAGILNIIYGLIFVLFGTAIFARKEIADIKE